MTRKKSHLGRTKRRTGLHHTSEFLPPTTSPFRTAMKRKLTPMKSPIQQPFRSPLYKAKRKSHRELFKDNDNRDTNWVIDMNSQIQSDNAPNPMNDIFDKEENNNKCSATQTQNVTVENCTQTENDYASNILTNPNIANNIAKELKEMVDVVVEKLSLHSKLHLTLLTFFKLIVMDLFPLDNIALMLWSDVVRWFDTSNTTHMRYSEDTKLFWKIGWRLFGCRFVNFMAGFKNQSEYSLGISEKSKYSPKTSKINFAVPDIKVLRSFDRFKCDSQRDPGIYDDVISLLEQNAGHMSFCLTFDGKKLKQGLTQQFGDVDLIGFENGPTLMEKRSILQQTTEDLSVLSSQIRSQFDKKVPLKRLPDELKAQLKHFLLNMLKTVSTGKHEMEQIKRKKEYAKDKLMERSDETNWRNGKFGYAISAIIAYIYDIDTFVGKSEKVIREICVCVASLNGKLFVDDRNVSLENNSAFYAIDELQNVDENYSTRLIKQRTERWFELRASAKITGSTLYKGLGFDGLKNQKDYFEGQFCGVPSKTPSEYIANAMKHGQDNEINAVATLVGKILPVVLPDLVYCEEGCVVVHDECLNPFLVVSPDGSLRRDVSMKSSEYAVEIKCPIRDVHYELPERYLLQCLSEIEALDVGKLIYLSWTDTFTSVFIVDRNKSLFAKAMQLANSLFGGSKIEMPTRLPDQIKLLKEEMHTCCKTIPLIGLFPSAVVGNPKTCSDQERTVYDMTCLLESVQDFHARRYELKREKASESIVFICSDLNRSWDKNTRYNVPVAWLTKGYSLDTQTMRQISEGVHMKCHAAGIHIPCQSFDGQWHNIVTRTIDNKPLTILQLQKDVWREVEQMRKQTIITKFREINTCPTWFVAQNDKFKRIIVSNYITDMPKLKLERNKPSTKENTIGGTHEIREDSNACIDKT
ncbi:uncharacterized protein LOC127869949 [Dreissena polymorpha]|uniref:uncharacterized protein LOC127869949 n=1 Tax=Dreissena polymorpha TaxID=45954 RepID=UPI00226537B9|nr:uncharacterized protein LOC127869949 [Dreissena polymorpha]